MFNPDDFIDSNQKEFESEIHNILFGDTIKEYYCDFVEKKRLPDLYGKTILVTEKQYPEIYNIIRDISNLIDMDPPKCFIYDDFFYDVSSHGINHPWIEVSCKSITDFNEKEFTFYIAKELCNIKMHHTEHYEIIDLYLQMMENVSVPLSSALAKSEKYLLYRWCRASCFTSDTFGMVISNSVEDSFSAILKTILNNPELAKSINISEYLNQADAINAMNDFAFNDTKLDEKVPYGNIRIKKILAYLSTRRGINTMLKYVGS